MSNSNHRESSSPSENSKVVSKRISVGRQLRAILFYSWFNLLLIAVPVGFTLYYAKESIDNPAVPVFIVNFIAIIPLAGMLSWATEELALHVGETLGGLLNATFGNAVELIVAVQALIKNEITIVKTSLIGSMLSNLLLVMGMSFFFGGLRCKEQFFHTTVAQTAGSLLALSVGSLVIANVFYAILQDTVPKSSRNQGISRGTALILLSVYGCYLYFQLKTHIAMYNEPSRKASKRKSLKTNGLTHTSAETAATSNGTKANSINTTQEGKGENPGDTQESQLSIFGATITLIISTALVAFCSEFMVDSINGITANSNVSPVFVGLILLPIVGNAAEHFTAVTSAIKDKMEIAIGVAVGSSIQIALFVLPLIVIIGWIAGRDDMTLFFDTFQIATLSIAVLLVNYLIQDGKSHWLEGVLLMASYLIITLAAWFYPETAVERKVAL